MTTQQPEALFQGHPAMAAPQQEAQEPAMIYHGRCTIDCGEGGHHDMEMLRMIPAGSKLYTAPQPAPHLPERDASLPAERQGLFRKFVVGRVDGSDKPGGKHHGCTYFVLDVDHDPCARPALAAYAAACESTHPTLAADLRTKWGEVPAPQPAPAPLIARSLAEWHEDDGCVAWWAWNGHEWAGEPAWIGNPNCEDWPGYHTHWTPHPDQPVFSALAAQGVKA